MDRISITTLTHFNNNFDAFQIECDQNIRFNGEAAREEFSELCAITINEYPSLHYGIGTIDYDGDGVMSDIDCDDTDPDINPDAEEIPYNGIDDDCDPNTLDDDLDQDGFDQADDCDDSDPDINPEAEEILDNQIDENCDGIIVITSPSEPNNPEPEPELEPESKNKYDFIIYPNPANQNLYIEKADNNDFKIEIFDANKRLVFSEYNQSALNIAHLSNGIYFLIYHDLVTGKKIIKKWVVLKR